MDLLKVIKERRSIRAYKPDPIPKERIEEILKLTIHAPSAINLQPWEFIVITGEEKERLSRRLIKAYKEKQIACSPGNVKPLPKTYGKRGAKTLALMKPFFEEMKVDIDPHLFEEGFHQFEGFCPSLSVCFWQGLDVSRTAGDLFFLVCLDEPSAQSLLFFSDHDNKFPGLEIDRRGSMNG